MTHRDEDEEIIDGALDHLAWQRREIDRLKAEVERLASFIMHCIEGEPSQSQGAVDTAIRIMTEQATTIGEQLAEVEGLRDLLVRGYVVCDGDDEDAVAFRNDVRAALGEK